MKKVWTAVMFLAMALGVGAVRAQDDADAAKAAEAAAAAAAKAKRIRDRSCLGIASRALCIAKGAGVAGDLKDAKPGDGGPQGKQPERDGPGWYVGAAVGSGTGLFRTAKGVSSSFEVGVFLLKALTTVNSGPPMIGRNLIVGWMPLDMAKSADEASAKGASIVWEATKASFPGSTFSAETMESGAVAYRVSGGVCEGKDCLLMPVLKKEGSPELMGGVASESKTPFILGRKPTYGFEGRRGALYPMTLVVDGRMETQSYLRELSRQLPEWLYVTVSPETKLNGGAVFNEGQAEPVVFHQGRSLLFRFPDQEEDSTVALR